MNKLNTDEIRFLRRWLSIEEDTERDILLRAMKPKDDWSFLWWLILALGSTSLLGYLTDIDKLEAWIR